MPNKRQDIYYHPIEINIEAAGDTIKIEQPLPHLYDMVEGVFFYNPGGNQNGTIKLSVGGEEIFPSGFHVRNFMCTQSSNKDDATISKDYDSYMHEISEKAKGATVSGTYTESENGEKGVIYIFFKLTKQNK